jgi:hypothetical protein
MTAGASFEEIAYEVCGSEPWACQGYNGIRHMSVRSDDAWLPRNLEAVSESSPPRPRRPKSELRRQLELLEPGRRLTINYGKRKTPFSVVIAIKRQQLKKHFVFREVSAGIFEVWVGDKTERSISLKPASES